MKTKAQKKEQIEQGISDLQSNASVIVTDFTGLSVNEVNTFRRALQSAGAKLSLVKKRLLRLMLEHVGVTFDTNTFEGQTAVVFSPSEMLDVATIVARFAKQLPPKQRPFFKILGGFEIGTKRYVEAVEVSALGNLPPREVLIGQFVGMVASPIRSLLFVLSERVKKIGVTS